MESFLFCLCSNSPHNAWKSHGGTVKKVPRKPTNTESSDNNGHHLDKSFFGAQNTFISLVISVPRGLTSPQFDTHSDIRVCQQKQRNAELDGCQDNNVDLILSQILRIRVWVSRQNFSLSCGMFCLTLSGNAFQRQQQIAHILKQKSALQSKQRLKVPCVVFDTRQCYQI